MMNCFQTAGMNMLQHGQIVTSYYEDLFNHLKHGTALKYEWKLPQLLIDHREAITSSALTPSEAYNYTINHDCGKFAVRIVDEDGKQHFPNHAEASYKRWIECGGDEATGWYILHDMDLHTLKGDELKLFLKDERIPTLLITAWSELHANASMFGGIESTSFKIKFKHLLKVTKYFFEENKNDK